VVRDDGTIILYSFLGGEQVNVSDADFLLRYANYTRFFTKHFVDAVKNMIKLFPKYLGFLPTKSKFYLAKAFYSKNY
jgi:hypothetical protein